MCPMNIQQHIYTRERRGLYRHREGYDSIAKSPGLCDGFVKGHVHPYCVFSAPKGPQYGNMKALTVVNYPCGRMLLGQAVHVPADFTGQRAAYFVHNYILPPEAANVTLEGMAGLLQGAAFLESYDINDGGELPELDAIPMKGEQAPAVGAASCRPWHQGDAGSLCDWDAVAELLIHCLTQSAQGAAKTYIITPVEAAHHHEYVCMLLSELYRRMPLPLKHVLGFCTYVREPTDKKGLHLLFVEKGWLWQNDSRLTRDFVIDMALPMSKIKSGATKPTGPILGPVDFFRTLVSSRVSKLPAAAFFKELNFWQTRLPKACESNDFRLVISHWADKSVDCMSLAELKSIPLPFIQWGKNGPNPLPYVILEILRKVIQFKPLSESANLRYYLGSYRLSADSYARVLRNLDRLFIKHSCYT